QQAERAAAFGRRSGWRDSVAESLRRQAFGGCAEPPVGNQVRPRRSLVEDKNAARRRRRGAVDERECILKCVTVEPCDEIDVTRAMRERFDRRRSRGTGEVGIGHEAYDWNRLAGAAAVEQRQ